MAKINIYKYGDWFKIIWDKTDGVRDLDTDDIFISGKDKDDEENEKNKSTEKLQNNIIRAKSQILEYAHCNDWEYFFNLTLAEGKQNRFNLDSFQKALGYWIGNYNKKYSTSLKYLLVPEKHKNGAWHMHGLFNNVAPESLIINEHGYLDLPYYKERFGWISLSKIKSKDRVSFYITKYVSKDLSQRSKDVGKHLFYASQGLNKKEHVISIGVDIEKKYLDGMYQNDYCGILWSKDVPTFILEGIKKDYATSDSDVYDVLRSYRVDI